MGMFAMRKPRGFNHSYIYVDERKEKLAKMEETHLKRRKESGRKPMHLGIILVVIAVLIYLWYAISNGII